MADIDLLPPRGVPRLALVDGTGIASNGSQTVLQLARGSYFDRRWNFASDRNLPGAHLIHQSIARASRKQ